MGLISRVSSRTYRHPYLFKFMLRLSKLSSLGKKIIYQQQQSRQLAYSQIFLQMSSKLQIPADCPGDHLLLVAASLKYSAKKVTVSHDPAKPVSLTTACGIT